MYEQPRTRPSLLVRLKGERDERAWAEFSLIYEPLVLRLMHRRGLQECDARDATQDAKKLIKGSVDPSQERKKQKRFLVASHDNTFEKVARD